MYLIRRIGLYTALLAVLCSVVLPTRVHAQTANPPVRPPLNLTTSPLPLNVTTKPGEPVTADIRIKNNGTQPELLKVDLLKFGAAGDTGRPQLLDRDPKDQYFNWVSFSETNFMAEPNVWKTVHMKISPPKEAAFGYYYAVEFTRANPDKPSGGRSALEGGIASLVLLTVEAPGARREAQVTELTATQRVYEFLPAHFTVRMHNGGNVHVAPTGTMFIKRGSAQVAAIDFNAERGNILPGTNRTFELSWSDGFPAYTETEKDGKKTQQLKWDFSEVQKLRFGRYTAHLVAVYDDGQRDVPVEAIVSFWVIPWRILGVIFLILLIILIGIWGIGRMIWRGFKRQVIVSPPAAGAGDNPNAIPLPIPEEQPDPSSLAAAPRRGWRKKKSQEAGPQAAQPSSEAIADQQAIAELSDEKPVRKRGRPPKVATDARPTPGVQTKKPAVPKPKAAAKPRLAGKKNLATKPRPTLATKGRPAAKPAARRKKEEGQ